MFENRPNFRPDLLRVIKAVELGEDAASLDGFWMAQQMFFIFLDSEKKNM